MKFLFFCITFCVVIGFSVFLLDQNNAAEQYHGKHSKESSNLDSLFVMKKMKADSCKAITDELVFVRFNAESKRLQLADSSKLRELLIQNAEKLLGTEYKYGGNDSTGLDCSSFIELAYLNTGIWIPRMAHNQANIGVETSLKTAKKGDLIFYGQTIDSTVKITHVGMVYSNSEKAGFATIHCVSSGVLINKGISNVWKNYWESKVLFVRSVL